MLNTILCCDRHGDRATRADRPSFAADDRSRDSGLGRPAEDLVAARLAAAGWEIVERNARTRFGELDIVALDGRTLVFVEVKAGREGADLRPGAPGPRGRPRASSGRVRRLATAWMAERRDAPRYAEIRFDAVGVTFDRAGPASRTTSTCKGLSKLGELELA